MCAGAKTCCDCLGRKINGVQACVFDVARKRQAGACLPAAARKRDVESIVTVCPCGDGERCGAEQCDEGLRNGKPDSCCDTTCRFVRQGTTCRAADGPCDVEDKCPGNAGKCPDAVADSRTVCRQSAPGKTCDKPENCDGRSKQCPADGAWDSSRVCRAARSGQGCDAEERCNGRDFDCGDDVLKPAGAICRASIGTCDVVELCDGQSSACPADIVKPSGTLCEAANGVCDLDDVCDGVSGSCRRVFKQNDVCRAAAGACDREERCAGNSANCPQDAKHGNSQVCRMSQGVCDNEERCDGRSDSCPADQKRSGECRRSAGPCDVAEVCDGSSVSCPTDVFRSPQTMCASDQNCEAAAFCSGSTASCPARAKKPTGSNCTTNNACFADQLCQADGTCAGGRFVCDCRVDGDCRSDSVCGIAFCDTAIGKCKLRAAANSVVCREAGGECGVETKCDGRSTTCPAQQQFLPASRTCRASGGPCDVEEKCTGSSASCPPNAFVTGGVCRNATGPCDVAELCSGDSAACPSDVRKGAGDSCISSDRCVRDATCTASGSCSGTNLCECVAARDCWPIVARKRDIVRIEDPCMLYECSPSNTCRVSKRDSCALVDRCVAGSAGCACLANKSCSGSLKCNSTSNFCEDNRCAVAGLPGCQCNANSCSDVTKKRQASFLRCDQGMCRISEGRKPTQAPCTPGSQGCSCLPEQKCAEGSCVAGVCTNNCAAGSAGCACNLKAAALCSVNATVCGLQSRCVYFPEDCGKFCTRGDPGCCCREDRSCAEVERKKREIFVNTCSADGLCLIESLPGVDLRLKCGTRKVGATWTNDASQSCRCLETGEQCDKDAACFVGDDQLKCHKTPGCIWSTAAPHSGVCQSGDGKGKTGGPCNDDKTCSAATDKCDEALFTCVGVGVGVSVTGVVAETTAAVSSGARNDAFVAASLALTAFWLAQR